MESDNLKAPNQIPQPEPRFDMSSNQEDGKIGPVIGSIIIIIILIVGGFYLWKTLSYDSSSETPAQEDQNENNDQLISEEELNNLENETAELDAELNAIDKDLADIESEIDAEEGI